MINWLVQVDAGLFYFLNVTLANPVFDLLMPLITSNWLLRPVIVLILLYLVIFGKRQGRITAIICIVTVIATDQISAHLLKPIISRIRPCHVLPDIHLLVNCSKGLSFPSAHAANAFGQAVILALGLPRRAWLFYLAAFVISYSRIAVGVHYPADVIAGALLGAVIALGVYGIYLFANSQRQRHLQPEIMAEKSGK
ncbi:MAG: phosphatase PAP2 family protein [candidate division Zixibacteria bacterium]|nr:phosphatase PAP2 family protein [candidate division Zixibacteria bacterium]